MGGSTPSTLMLAALSKRQRGMVRERMQLRFPVAFGTGQLEVTAEALVVRGQS